MLVFFVSLLTFIFKWTLSLSWFYFNLYSSIDQLTTTRLIYILFRTLYYYCIHMCLYTAAYLWVFSKAEIWNHRHFTKPTGQYYLIITNTILLRILGYFKDRFYDHLRNRYLRFFINLYVSSLLWDCDNLVSYYISHIYTFFIVYTSTAAYLRVLYRAVIREQGPLQKSTRQCLLIFMYKLAT